MNCDAGFSLPMTATGFNLAGACATCNTGIVVPGDYSCAYCNAALCIECLPGKTCTLDCTLNPYGEIKNT
jgi:hypothetical protein